MRRIFVQLPFLNNKKDLTYEKTGFVVIEVFHVVGMITLERDKNGQLYGIIDFDEDVSDDRYFYYRELVTTEVDYHFEGIQLLEHPIMDKPTTLLRDMIIEQPE